ncbi:sensor histidine kinase [Mucilaginibacter sp. PPCGB 2223]|uniref:sensor histidine kinase n=1 Tax=Mucilaginibacter sp. PPCGB 2223 TaxID=1886027 RepID=UPI001586269C|nr:histidine kinase [Mucilaginibacter sp. PPCGB 2223]
MLFVIAVGVVLLYVNFQKNLYRQQLDKAALKSSQQEDLLRNSIQVQEEERKRVASDLHDELGAVISIIRMNLVLIQQKVKKQEDAAPGMESAIEGLISLSESGISSVRNISHQLMPPQLELFGLIKTLERFAETINASGKIDICLSVKNELPEMDWPVTLGLYRISMELINNTIKHAGAKKITMEFDYDNHQLMLNFKDDGKGLDTNGDSTAGMGFKNMEIRISALKGNIAYGNNAEGAGFTAAVKIPFNID